MPQLRLTYKMARELKILELNSPNNCINPYDDWYVDVIRILRKKIFVFMHIHSKMVLAIPSYEIGGIHGVFEYFALLLRKFLHFLGYEKIANEVYDYFSCPKPQINFVKTNDKSTLRYISTFKLQLQITAQKFNDIDQLICDDVSNSWLKHFIKDPDRLHEYTTPGKLLKKLLS